MKTPTPLLLLLATPHPLTASPPPLTITLPYALYTGVRTPLNPTNPNVTLTLTTWKGIRYASPPVGLMRWQRPQRPPQPPAAAAPAPVLAATAGPACPQAMPAIPGLGFVAGEEDCLFLNVWAASSPRGEEGLAPVLVVIHGGGYGLGGAGTDMTSFLEGGGEEMVVVEVQYRVHPLPPSPLFKGLTPAARRLRLPRVSRRQAPRRSQRRPPGPETRARVGAGARGKVRRRSAQGDDHGGVGGGRVGDAACDGGGRGGAGEVVWGCEYLPPNPLGCWGADLGRGARLSRRRRGCRRSRGLMMLCRCGITMTLRRWRGARGRGMCLGVWWGRIR